MPKVQFGDVARECRENYKGDQTGMPVVGLEHLEPETMTLHAWGTSADNNFTKCFHKGQVLFGRRRAYLKKAVVAPFDGICSGDITVIEAKADSLNPELLPFIVQNDDFFRFAVGHSAGSLSPRVKWEHLQNYEFTLPSMAEQDELVELLRAMERTKNAYKELIIKTDELVKSQFVEMFGTPESVMNSSHTIAEVADVQVGIVIKPTRYYADGNEGIKAFRSLNIGPMYIKDDDWVYFTEEAMKETQRTVAHTDDILVVRSGSPGTSCVVPLEYDGCNVIDLIIAHPNKEKVLPKYLCAFTNMPHGMNQINSQQRGVAQKHFNVGMYKDLRLILRKLRYDWFQHFKIQSD